MLSEIVNSVFHLLAEQKMTTVTEQKPRPPGEKPGQIHMEFDGKAQSLANHGISQFVGKMKMPRQDLAASIGVSQRHQRGETHMPAAPKINR